MLLAYLFTVLSVIALINLLYRSHSDNPGYYCTKIRTGIIQIVACLVVGVLMCVSIERIEFVSITDKEYARSEYERLRKKYPHSEGRIHVEAIAIEREADENFKTANVVVFLVSFFGIIYLCAFWMDATNSSYISYTSFSGRASHYHSPRINTSVHYIAAEARVRSDMAEKAREEADMYRSLGMWGVQERQMTRPMSGLIRSSRTKYDLTAFYKYS
ncbi:hypothetical protein FACS1894204_11060 [Synergistales bacterium]|nr:hypothetical protein FACS1894204_11060 [Synergistales bacterium]